MVKSVFKKSDNLNAVYMSVVFYVASDDESAYSASFAESDNMTCNKDDLEMHNFSGNRYEEVATDIRNVILAVHTPPADAKFKKRQGAKVTKQT